MDSPVFADDSKRRFDSWDTLLEATPPQSSPYLSKLLCVCEDQNVWPISNEIMPDIQDREMQFKEFAQDAEQNAVASATRNAQGNLIVSAWSFVSLTIFCLVAVVILLIALQSDLTKGFFSDKTSALMVSPLLLGAIKFPRFKRTKREPKPKKIQYRNWETVRVYDELAGYTWSCSMPLKILTQNLPIDCRYTQEIASSKITAAALYGFGLLAPSFFLLIGAGAGMVTGAILSVIFGSMGAIFGWWRGYRAFMDAPIWIVRRVYKQIIGEDGQAHLDFDALPEVIPEYHTKLNNMPLPLAREHRRAEVDEVIRQTSQKQNGMAAVLIRQNLATAYTPRIWRAYVLYEMLKGRDIRAKMKGPNSKSDKMQKITMAGMALGSLGILVVALLLLGS
jgi:hypothetical protein